MTLVVARRICQVFFFALFLWFCAVMRLGESWHQLRGWPVNWFLNLDPLNGLATVLSTRTLYAGLWWGALVLVLTLVLGRFFCGWVCPFGVLHHFAGYLGNRGKKRAAKIRGNQPHRAQNIKYIVLIFFLAGAFDLPPVRLPPEMFAPGGGDLVCRFHPFGRFCPGPGRQKTRCHHLGGPGGFLFGIQDPVSPFRLFANRAPGPHRLVSPLGAHGRDPGSPAPGGRMGRGARAFSHCGGHRPGVFGPCFGQFVGAPVFLPIHLPRRSLVWTGEPVFPVFGEKEAENMLGLQGLRRCLPGGLPALGRDPFRRMPGLHELHGRVPG